MIASEHIPRNRPRFPRLAAIHWIDAVVVALIMTYIVALIPGLYTLARSDQRRGP